MYKSQNILKKGIGIDLNFAGKKHSDNKKINFLKKINQINDLDFKFDSIFLFHVFEHLVNPIEVLTQLESKLKKNGNLIIEVPHANDLLLKKFKKQLPSQEDLAIIVFLITLFKLLKIFCYEY